MKKKIFAMLLVCTMTFAGSVQAIAMEPTIQDPGTEGVLIGSFTVNEYDSLVQSGRATDIASSSDSSIETAVLERAQLPVETLLAYGYSNDEIAILKAYDGSPIEDNPQLRGTFANLNGFIYRMDYNDYGSTVRFSWVWDSAPVLHGSAITDVVTCAWVGVNSTNGPHALRIQSAESICEVDYYQGETFMFRETVDIDDADVNTYVNASFNVGSDNVSALSAWAKKGYMDVSVSEAVSVGDLEYSTFVFAYGHQTLTASAGFSVSASGISISISPKFGTEQMYNGSVSTWTNGQIEWNGDAA